MGLKIRPLFNRTIWSIIYYNTRACVFRDSGVDSILLDAKTPQKRAVSYLCYNKSNREKPNNFSYYRRSGAPCNRWSWFLVLAK